MGRPVIASRLFTTAAFAAMLLAASLLTEAPRAEAKSIEVEATPVELYERKPYRTSVGKLEYLAGFELFSSEPSFGGLSGLSVSSDGQTLHAVSDQGDYFTARLAHDAGGRLTAIDSWNATPLLPGGAYGDAEAMTLDKDGAWLISFEGRHRIMKIPSANGKPAVARGKEVPVPADLANAPFNGGLESITLLRDGTLMALTEHYENPDGSVKGWFIRADSAAPFSYRTLDGFSPTDLATLPGGDVLVLERKFGITNMQARIRRLTEAELRPGRTLEGVEIADIAHPLTVDNFEGLAVRAGANGSTLIYIVSDDNFLPIQRPLLLQFRLSP